MAVSIKQFGFSFSIAVLSFTTALSGMAEQPPSNPPFENYTWKPSLKEKPSVGLKMGELYIEFEKTTLDEVRQVVGVGEIVHDGDAGSSLYWLCYTNLDLQRVDRIWITSHGEMGGPNHEINGVDAEIFEERSATKGCPALPVKFRPVSLERGLWLAMRDNVVHSTLGAPSFKKGSWESFDHEGKVYAGSSCGSSGFDQSNSIAIRFRNGIVTSLRMWQVTSC